MKTKNKEIEGETKDTRENERERENRGPEEQVIANPTNQMYTDMNKQT